MKLIIISLLCLTFVVTKCQLSALEALEEKPHHESTHLADKILEEYGWNDKALQLLATFHSQVSTDEIEAHLIITKVSQIRFGKHPLTHEWSELFFRLYRDKKGSLLDLRRYFELEHQLLSSISPEKYQKAIEECQSGVKQFDSMIALIESQGQTPETIEGNFNFQFTDD